MPKLYIGNKNYSSWSMRPWVLLRQAGIAFEEVPVRFDSFDANSQFKRQLKADGGSKAFLNDQSVGVALLREIDANFVADAIPELLLAERTRLVAHVAASA